MADKKRALVHIHTARTFQQFLMIYAERKDDYVWDMLADKEGVYEDVVAYYEPMGIFDKIYPYKEVWDKRWLMLAKCVIGYIFGKKKSVAKSILNENIGDYTRYDLIITAADYNSFVGAAAMLGDEMEVINLDEGTLTYLDRNRMYKGGITSTTFNILSYALARMGYQSNYGFYANKSTWNVTHYVLYPEKVVYGDYKALKELVIEDGKAMETYRVCIKQFFGLDIESLEAIEDKVILFTSPVDMYDKSNETVVRDTINHIEKNYPNHMVILKKHPRDEREYNFTNNKCLEIDKTIPGELILDLQCKMEFFMFPSAVAMDVKGGNYKIFYYSDLENKQEWHRVYNIAFDETIEMMGIEENNIIRL